VTNKNKHHQRIEEATKCLRCPTHFKDFRLLEDPLETQKNDEEAILLRIAQISLFQFYWFFNYKNYYENLLRVFFNDDLYRVMSAYA